MAKTNYDGKFDWGREKTGNVKIGMGESAGKGTLMGSAWYATWRDLIWFCLFPFCAVAQPWT